MTLALPQFLVVSSCGLLRQNPVVKHLSDIHVYCAVLLMIIVTIQMLRPKGTDPAKSASHMFIGRILSFGIAPHYVFLGCVLNYYAIMLNVEDWQLAPPASDWRLQISYIVPFAINTFVAMAMGFWLCRYSFMPKGAATLLKWLSLASIIFWCTVGVYQTGSQAFGLGLGGFGLDPKKVIPGGTGSMAVQEFFNAENLIVFFVGNMQAGQDLVAYKVLSVIEKTGNKEIAWVDMHKWAMVDLAYQAGVIFGLFVAFFPYCLYGAPDYMCLKSPFFAAPFITFFLLPVLPLMPWAIKFISALFGGRYAEFSKGRHKWDLDAKTA